MSEEDIKSKTYYQDWKTVLIPRIRETKAWSDMFDGISSIFAELCAVIYSPDYLSFLNILSSWVSIPNKSKIDLLTTLLTRFSCQQNFLKITSSFIDKKQSGTELVHHLVNTKCAGISGRNPVCWQAWQAIPYGFDLIKKSIIIMYLIICFYH